MTEYNDGKLYEITLRATYSSLYDTFVIGTTAIPERYLDAAREIKHLPTTPSSVIEWNGSRFVLTENKTHVGTPIWWPVTGGGINEAIEYYGAEFKNDWILKFDAGA